MHLASRHWIRFSAMVVTIAMKLSTVVSINGADILEETISDQTVVTVKIS